MDARKSMVIAEYLIREYVVNPVFRRSREVLIGAVLFLAFLAIGLIIAFTAPAPPQQEGGGTTTQTHAISAEIRHLIHSVGLNKDRLVDIISSLLMLYLAINVVRRGKLVVSGAVYELVLSQPISIDTYIMGDALYKAMLGLLITPFYLLFLPLALDLNGGDMKALIIPFSIFTVFFLFGELSSKMGKAVSKFLEERGALKPARLAVATYLLIAATHSALLRYPSPLLTTPLRGLPELLVYPLTTSEGLTTIALSLIKAYLVIALCFAAVVLTGKYITPEDVAPLPEVIRGKAGKSLRKARAMRLNLTSPSAAVRSYVLGSSVARLRHALNVGVLIAVAAVVAFIARHAIVMVYGPVGLGSAFITSILIPIAVAVSSNAFISTLLANDVPSYWVYRVYLVRMGSVATSLMLKYLVYLTEALLLMSVVDTILTQNCLYLLFPLTVLPSMTIASFLVLATLTYFASKKRVVKYTETRMTVLEETASSVVTVVLIVFILLSKAGYVVMLSINLPLTIILAAVLSSIALAAVLLVALSKVLAKLMERYDVLS